MSSEKTIDLDPVQRILNMDININRNEFKVWVDGVVAAAQMMQTSRFAVIEVLRQYYLDMPTPYDHALESKLINCMRCVLKTADEVWTRKFIKLALCSSGENKTRKKCELPPRSGTPWETRF